MIRAKYLGYNDEVFYVAGNRIANVFDNKQQAELAYKKLEIDGARDFALYEVESLFDADEALLQQLDDFVYSRCGEHICEEGYGYEYLVEYSGFCFFGFKRIY